MMNTLKISSRRWSFYFLFILMLLVPAASQLSFAEDADLGDDMEALERELEIDGDSGFEDMVDDGDFVDDVADTRSMASDTQISDDFDDEMAEGDELQLDDEVLGFPEGDDVAKGGVEREPDLEEFEDMEGLDDGLELPEDPQMTEVMPGMEGDADKIANDLNLDDLPGMEFTEQGTAAAAPQTPVDPGFRVDITNLEFKMEGASSRIVVTSSGSLRYRVVKNPQMRQIVLFFENSSVPDRLQRAYDTTEFRSPVALFTLLQVPGEVPPVSKLIIQLREDSEPKLLPTERGLFVDFGPPTKADEPRLVLDRGSEGKLTEGNVYSSDQIFTGKILRRLEIKDSDVQDVLRLIARTSGYNIVIGDDVTGKVGTLSLENVPWDQVFTLILQLKKLGYVRQGNVLRVATLQSLAQEKSDALANEQARVRVEPLKTLLIPVSYAQAGTLAPQGQSFLTDRGTIATDERTNTIIVKDIAQVVEKVKKLYMALDSQPPRVSVAARIVEVSNRFSRTFGTNTLQLGSGALNVSLGGNGLGLAVATGAGGVDFSNVTATFSAAEQEGQVKTLANPSVSVVANQPAVVNQSLSFFVERQIFVPGSNGQVSGTQEVTTNLTLEVTPIVAGDGTIFLTVRILNEVPNLDNPDSPQIDTRNIDTQVLLENGDTVVLGSIFSNTVSRSISGVPFLMRIPVLGFLLSENLISDVRNEVFVFLTAKIMNAEEAFKRVL